MTQAVNGTNGTPRKGRAPRPEPAAREKGGDRWIPIADDTLEAVMKVRSDVQKKTKMRPDLSTVVAAMLRHAAASPDLVDAVARHGLDVYARSLAAPEVKPPVTPDPAPAATP